MNLIVWNYVLLFQVMTRYISNPDNLKLMMNMLKEKSRNIQFEAFHVFKVWNSWWKYAQGFVSLERLGIFLMKFWASK